MRLFAIFLLAAVLPTVFFSFKKSPEKVALERATAQMRLGIEDFSEALEGYKNAVAALSTDEKSIQKLRSAHESARLSFKKIELFLEHFDRSTVKKSLNGPPLPSVVPNVPNVIAVEPMGLQRLEELIFQEKPVAEKAEIERILNLLSSDFEAARAFLQNQKLEHRHVFEAARQEVVRVFALGLAGFDAPASGNSLAEAATALRAVGEALSHYQILLFEKDKGLAIVLEARLAAAVETLQNADDFDGFDRLDFLKNHADPLFELIGQAHRSLGVETVAEVSGRLQPTRFEARSLFADDFLNAGFFANQDLDAPNFEAKKELGRALFYEKSLSKNGKTSCASCHRPELAFTDGEPKSLAADGKNRLRRNAPTLVNCVFSTAFFADLREPNLEKQIAHVVLDTAEFSTDYFEIGQKLSASPDWQKRFAAAYPALAPKAVSAFSVADALAAFVASLTSFDSPFDRFVRGDTAHLDAAAYRGFNLFMGKAACGTCHFTPVFNGLVPPFYDDSEAEVIGVLEKWDTLRPPVLDSDLGKFASGQPRDRADFFKNAFKTPTVRNVALTAPFMHNGSIRTLAEVVDFYARGGGAGMGLDVPHQTLPFDKIELSAAERADLVAFMESLTSLPPTGKKSF